MRSNQSRGNEPNIARVYIRVSLQGPRGKGLGSGEFISPDLQLTEAAQYVKRQLPGYVLDEEASLRHQDIDRSASRLKWQKREGLVAHLEAARRGEFQALIFFKLSRFARNSREGHELFDLFEQTGCTLHSVKEEFINTKSNVGKLMKSLLLAIAEFESDNISEWVTAAFYNRVSKGKTHGPTAFWLSKNDDGEVYLNDRAWEMRRLVQLRLSEHSYVDAARILNAEGSRSSGGVKWTRRAIKYYMRPDKIRLMQGHFVYGTGKPEDDESRIILENVFPGVISQDEAEALIATNRRRTNLYSHNNERRAGSTTYILSGLVWCSQCESRMRSRNSDVRGSGGTKRRKSSYTCKYSETNNVPHPIGNTVSSDILEDAVLRVVRVAVADRARAVKSASPLKPKPKPVDTSFETNISKLDERINRLIAAYDSGDMKRADFRRRYDELDGQREALITKQNESDSDAQIRIAMDEAVKASAGTELSGNLARQLVLAFVERIEAPVKTDSPHAVRRSNRIRRAARVTLRAPLSDGRRTFIAPLYLPAYMGERLVLDDDGVAAEKKV